MVDRVSLDFPLLLGAPSLMIICSAQLATFASEVTRVAHEVGTKGNLGVTAKVDNIEGTWQEITYVSLSSVSS